MFLHDLASGLLRRWYLVLFGLLVTALGGYYLLQVVPVTYEATSSVVLVPPATAVIEGENPYLYMGGLDQALSVLTVRMSSPTVADPILHKRTDLTYTIGKDVSTAGPIVLVDAEAGTEAETLKILDQVVAVIPENLKLLQDQLNIPKNARITAMTIVTDTTAKEVNKKQMRVVLAAVAAGSAVTILGTGLLDRLLVRRKAKKALRRPKATKQTDPAANTRSRARNGEEANVEKNASASEERKPSESATDGPSQTSDGSTQEELITSSTKP